METLLVITTLVCAWNWLIRWMTTQILVVIFKERGYQKPTDEEISRSIKKVIKNRFKKEAWI